MKKIISVIIWAVVFHLSADCQNDIKTLKKAYKYRTDIDTKVLKETKNWPEKVGVLHSDWIENRRGKSMDLEGNELFPEYDYTKLERQGDFWIMTVGGFKGLLALDGEKLTDFEYTGFEFAELNYGYVIGHKNTGQNIKIQIRNKRSYNELCDADLSSFRNNGWVDRFAYYYNKADYKKARFCLDFFNVYDRSTMSCAYSLPHFLNMRYSLLIYEMTEDYQSVIDIVQQNMLSALTYDAKTDRLELASGVYCSPALRKSVTQEIGYLNENYLSCKLLKEVKAQQRAERNERLAVAAAVLVGAAAMTTAVVVSEQQAKQEREAQQRKAAAAAKASSQQGGQVQQPSSTSSSSDDDDLDDGSVEVEEIHVTCDRCGGSGKCQQCGGTGHVEGVGGHGSVSCSGCERGKCVGCRGRGYNIKYK